MSQSPCLRLAHTGWPRSLLGRMSANTDIRPADTQQQLHLHWCEHSSKILKYEVKTKRGCLPLASCQSALMNVIGLHLLSTVWWTHRKHYAGVQLLAEWLKQYCADWKHQCLQLCIFWWCKWTCKQLQSSDCYLSLYLLHLQHNNNVCAVSMHKTRRCKQEGAVPPSPENNNTPVMSRGWHMYVCMSAECLTYQ